MDSSLEKVHKQSPQEPVYMSNRNARNQRNRKLDLLRFVPSTEIVGTVQERVNWISVTENSQSNLLLSKSSPYGTRLLLLVNNKKKRSIGWLYSSPVNSQASIRCLLSLKLAIHTVTVVWKVFFIDHALTSSCNHSLKQAYQHAYQLEWGQPDKPATTNHYHSTGHTTLATYTHNR